MDNHNMNMKFSQLSIGQMFEFTEKTDVGCGMFNGKAVKKSDTTYVMSSTWWITRTIGDENVKVTI